MIDLAVLVIKGIIICEILRDRRHLHILHGKFRIRGNPQGLIGIQDLAQILPAAGRGKLHAFSAVFDTIEVFLLEIEIRDHSPMQAFPQGVFFPDREILLHGDALDTVERDHIKIAYRAVVFRRIACRNDQPALRKLLVAKGFALQKLQHHGGQGFGYAVDLIKEKNPLAESGFFHQLIHRAENLAHGVLGNGMLDAVIVSLFDKRQPDGTLTGVMRDGIGDETDVFLGCELLHDLGLSDSRRADQQDRPLPNRRDTGIPQFIPGQGSAQRVSNLFFGLFDVHVNTS